MPEVIDNFCDWLEYHEGVLMEQYELLSESKKSELVDDYLSYSRQEGINESERREEELELMLSEGGFQIIDVNEGGLV